MAKINTTRPEAMAYQGMSGRFVRDVVANEPAHSNFVDQVIVNINGTDLYFYASEVTLDEGEEKRADKQRSEWEKEAGEAESGRQERAKNKAEMLAGYKRGSDVDPTKDSAVAAGGIAPMDIPAHQGATPQQVLAGTSPFNRVPGQPARTAEQDGAESNMGEDGYPEGSGPDPQGRRVNEKDQSKSNPSERPVPGHKTPEAPEKPEVSDKPSAAEKRAEADKSKK